jgi:hypothetical protein
VVLLFIIFFNTIPNQIKHDHKYFYLQGFDLIFLIEGRMDWVLIISGEKEGNDLSSAAQHTNNSEKKKNVQVR